MCVLRWFSGLMECDVFWFYGGILNCLIVWFIVKMWVFLGIGVV